MQNHDEQQPGRLAEVDQPPDGRVAEDLLRVAQVRADEVFARYAGFGNYRRLLDREGAASPGALAVTGTGSEIEKQLRRLADAGVTELWPIIFPVGDDPGRSRRETRALLRSLATV